jgi:hypothetical protein
MTDPDKPRAKLAAIKIPSAGDASFQKGSRSDEHPLVENIVEAGAKQSRTVTRSHPASRLNKLEARFNSNDSRDSKNQRIPFYNWSHRYEMALDIIAAFEIVFKNHSSSTREVTKRNFDHFLLFLESYDKHGAITSIVYIDQQYIDEFKNYLEQNISNLEWRKDIWLSFRSVATEMLVQAEAEGIKTHPILIPLSPWPTNGERGYKRNGSTSAPGWTAVFPLAEGKPPQVLPFSHWKNRGDFGSALLKAFITVNFHTGPGTRRVRRIQLNDLKKFLDKADPGFDIKGVNDFCSEHARAFKEFLDGTGKIDRTKKKIWNNFRSVFSQMVIDLRATTGIEHKIVMEHTPWPGASKRGNYTQALSLGDAGVLLNACITEMNETLAEAAKFGHNYAGPSVAELLPFIIPLTFWTLFNPDTAIGLKVEDIKPAVLGRIAIISEDKGRSNQDQIATFSVDDTHICAPPVLVRNIMALTKGLREHCSNNVSKYLFIGQVLNTNSQ